MRGRRPGQRRRRREWFAQSLGLRVARAFGLVLTAGLLAAPSAAAIEPDGTIIQVTGSPAIYRVVGGAAIHLDSCAPFNGCAGLVQVANLAGYAPAPGNGAFMRIADGAGAGWIGVFIGGTPIHVDTCAPLGGCAGTVNIDSGGVSDYMRDHPIPSNGSLIRIPDGPIPGWIGVFINGSPVHIDSCGPFAGCAGVVNVDAAGAAEYVRAHPYPPNGSFMRIADGPAAGWIGVFVNGTPIHVDSCAPLGGCNGLVNVDSGGVTEYVGAHPTPPNGSFVLVADGAQAGLIARAAGGALLPLTDCGAIGGCAGWVMVDSGGFADYTKAHPVPADGTLLLGLPSNTTWDVVGGARVPAAPSTAAVAVDDTSLAGIPVVPPPASGTTTVQVPQRHRVRVKFVLSWRWNRGRTLLRSIRMSRLSPRATIRITCTGGGCPRRRSLVAKAHHLRRLLRALTGHVFHAGDRILIVVSVPGRVPERVLVVIRNGREPVATLLP